MKKILKISAIALISLGSTACMNLEPLDSMGDNLVWNSADNFQLYANQFYSWKSDFTGGWRGRLASGSPHSDYSSDLLCRNVIDYVSAAINTIPATDGNYTGLYSNLYRTNLLLDRAQNFNDKAAIAVPMGEAYFFRAFLHFELVQMYGDVLLVTKPLDISSPELYAARTPRAEVIRQCVADLKAAADLLPEKESEAGRVNKYAALALLSRVALSEATWDKFNTNGPTATSNTAVANELLPIARDAAAEVINSGNYTIFYNSILGNESYRYMFILEDGVQCNPAGLTSADNTEYILVSRRRQGIDQLGMNITHAVTVSTANEFFITRKMANMYLCDDGLPIEKSPRFKGYSAFDDEYKNRDNRMSNTMMVPGTKYFNNDECWRVKWDASDFDQPKIKTANPVGGSGYHIRKWATEREVADYYESYDYPMIRYAEVLLNYAEAVYELDGKISDNDLNMSINIVRKRVNPDMPGLSNSLVSNNDLSMRQEIRRERTVELFTEGFRLDDLKRWNTAAEEMSQDLIGVKWQGTAFESKWVNPPYNINADGCLVIYTDRSGWKRTDKRYYLLPLPSDQLQLNPALGQNPGW
ncbi:MAG: RagB/SusD family nutrient uptake outer membrane protein [Bacteroidaceae bacterium]|nr:RagB/SusD family nutrient uptake outer membrane protein [Bacteroidaceae bacterium]